MLYTDDMDTPVDHDTRHMLHMLVMTWLISLAVQETEEDHGLWRPFTVAGLQQTMLDGSPCVIIAIGMYYTDAYNAYVLAEAFLIHVCQMMCDIMFHDNP